MICEIDDAWISGITDDQNKLIVPLPIHLSFLQMLNLKN